MIESQKRWQLLESLEMPPLAKEEDLTHTRQNFTPKPKQLLLEVCYQLPMPDYLLASVVTLCLAFFFAFVNGVNSMHAHAPQTPTLFCS